MTHDYLGRAETMTDWILGIMVTIFLLVYLTYSLLKGEEM